MKPASDKPPHPNRLPFFGMLTPIDKPSDMAPTGSRSKRVVLTREAAVNALETLIGMGLNFTDSWGGHDARRKCGVITDAWIEGDELLVSGYLYGRDFPEIALAVRKPGVEMGMSYEMCDAQVESMRASILKLTSVTFTGAAILLAKKAAYKTTRFSLAASAEKKRFTGRISFIDEAVRTGRATTVPKKLFLAAAKLD